ncbi:MAG: hypothetical protein IKU36_08730 [Bacteroidales bacterium]|nr:hypothetical protein [Bacteroidales bacterium]
MKHQSHIPIVSLIILNLLLLALSSSCDRASLDASVPSGTVSFVIREEGTRADVSVYGDEAVIGSVQLLLFDSKGFLVDRGSFSGTGTPYEFTMTPGDYTCCAFVNFPALSSFLLSLSSLDALYLDYFSSDSFSQRLHPMYGRISFSVKNGRQNLTVPVSRYASRYCLKSVESRLTGADIKLEHVYLTNVQGGFYYTVGKNTDFWYSRFGRPDSKATQTDRITSVNDVKTKEFTYKSLGGVSLSAGSTYTPSTNFVFYAFPNYSLQDRTGWASSFTERHTRMVLAVKISDEKYYYPVNLLNMQGNTSHDVKFIITRLGSPDPDTFDWATDEEKDVTIDLGELEDGDDIIIEF